ncbi:MAG: nucleoside hydrolase [Oscillospiraceae bacterium]
MERKTPIIIDCDPGHDDALAIMWALAYPEKLELRGITTCAGNQTLDKTTANALKILTVTGRTDIPVARGAAKPLVKQIEVEGTPIVHGQTGLDGPALPIPTAKAIELSAVELLIKLLEESDEKITLVPLAPLTNIAMLFTVRPDLIAKVERISLMGGGTMGNWTPAAEFNIWWDPEAARIVFKSGLPIIMAGLDVTQRAYVTREENEVLRAQGNEKSVLAAELIDFFSRYHYEVEGFPGCTLHDPCAVAALLNPEIFTSENCNVDIEVHGELTAGMTVIDRVNYIKKILGKDVDCNTTVLFDVDRQKFVESFFAAMKKLG